MEFWNIAVVLVIILDYISVIIWNFDIYIAMEYTKMRNRRLAHNFNSKKGASSACKSPTWP
jgi:hypothetical protein